MARIEITALLLASLATQAFAGSISDSASAFSEHRGPAATSESVTVFLPNRPAVSIPAFTAVLPEGSELSVTQVEQLTSYIQSNLAPFGLAGTVSLRLIGQSVVGKNVIVRFQQGVKRAVGARTYFIPIVGSTIVARVSGSRLASLNSSLVSEASILISPKHPGFEFDFSDTEMAMFIHAIKSSEAARNEAKNFFGSIARRANQPFDLDQFLNRELQEQKVLVNRFFGSLGPLATARILIELSTREQVAFVRYGDQWLMQLSGILGLPFQFDVISPESPDGKLVIVNLRENRTKATSVRGFESPHFPGGKKVEAGEHAERAAGRMKQISQYYSDIFGWRSFKGKGVDGEIHIHTRLKSVDFRENASWIGNMQKFIVGEGGTHLHRLEDSLSVLGHEYAHAILQFSSGLSYRGQSGALNEHFADIQGASIDALINNGGKFRFTVGEEVLTPQVKTEKAKLLELILSNRKYSDHDISRFSLQTIGLRHLFAPLLSFATQYDHVDELRKVYPDDCQPSVDNDNCGVHAASGIPNKAAAMIISELGVEETRSLFFNTAVYRLNQSSNFTDYLVQLHEECKDTPKIASRCDVIISSFASVGVSYPTTQMSTLAAPIVVSKKSVTPQTLVQLSTKAATPTLKLCGWVDRANADRIRIFDDMYNGTIIKRNYDVKTEGDYTALGQSECACVTGKLTQTTNARGEMFTAFLEVESVEDRGHACRRDSRIKDRRPSPLPDNVDTMLDQSKAHHFCGWVSVNSRSKNVTIIDNKYDVALLASDYEDLTHGDFSKVYRHQCACVKGKISQTLNAKGTTFNYFRSVEPRGVRFRPPEMCVGIQWK